jgi:hypothetical protein
VHRESYGVCIAHIVNTEVGPDFPREYALTEPPGRWAQTKELISVLRNRDPVPFGPWIGDMFFSDPGSLIHILKA